MKQTITLLCLVLSFSGLYSQNVGIGTAAPGAKLTVNGALASTPQSGAAGATITIPTNVTVFRITDDGASAANAVSATSPVDGQFLTIYNTDAQAATFAGQTIAAAGGVMTFQYINSGWRLVSDNQATGGNYIKNGTSTQASSDFNISSTGTVGTTLTVGTSTTSPVVQGSTAASGTLTLKSTASATKPAAGILMTDNIPSTSTTTGTAVITGGAGVSGNMNVGGTVTAGSSAIMGTGINGGYYQDATNGAYRSIVSSATTNGYYFQTNTGAATSMYVGLGGTYNGNVGIGTTTPAAALHLYQDKYTLYGPNSSWSSYLRVGGNGNVDNYASVTTTNGNLHMDASSVGPGNAMYLNYYKGTGGINFGNGAAAVIGSIDNTGYLTMNNVINSSVGYRVNGAATSGNYLRGNGTNFVSSAIQPADLSLGISGTINTIPKFTGANAIGNSVITDDGAGHVTFNPSVYTYFNTGTVYSNGNIVARGGVSNDGGTLSLTASNSLVNLPNGYLYVGGSNAIQGTDSWLRLNQPGSFTSGTYTPGFLRADGGIASGGVGSLGAGTINATSTIRGGGYQDANGSQVIDNGGGWHRSYGQTGWYNGTYSTGWYSTVAGEVATYNNSYIRVTGAANGSGNLRFDAANPYIVASSYYVCPGGAYFNSGTVYTEAQYQCRGGIHDDNHGDLTIAGGTNATTYFSGSISGMSGTIPPNNMVRLTPNLHLNSGAGNAVILNWDNGTTGTGQVLRIGNGASADAFIVQANGNTGISTTSPGNNKLYAYQGAGGAGSSYATGTVNAVYGAGAASTGAYTFGVTGYDIGSSARSGGTHGAYSSGTWGALGYVNSGSTSYGLYYTSSSSGAGYLPTTGAAGIGAGGYGDFTGSWTRGEVIGSISSGELMASYNQGNEYTSGHQADIVTVNNKRMAAFSSTSPDVQVSKAGTGKLINGKATITFDENYAGMLDKESRPVVTVSPIGNCNGIHIVSMSSAGFVIEENNGGAANVEFTYIVIGKRVDAASAAAPADILDAKFDENLKGVMFNEANTEQSAKPMWWDGSKVRFDAVPAEFKKKKEFKQEDNSARSAEVDQQIKSSVAKQKLSPRDPNAPTLEKFPVTKPVKAGYGNQPAMPGQLSDASQTSSKK